MVQITEIAQRLIQKHVGEGDIVIDATAGNGHDTEFLLSLVGSEGRVIACDLQSAAIEATRARCADRTNLELRLGDHAEILEQLLNDYGGKISAVLFNLGYLPGGDKSVTTNKTTTIAAIRSGLKLLKRSGILSILAYVGHPGGQVEADAVEACLSEFIETGTGKVVAWPEESLSKLSPRLFVLIRERTQSDAS